MKNGTTMMKPIKIIIYLKWSDLIQYKKFFIIRNGYNLAYEMKTFYSLMKYDKNIIIFILEKE